jgi:putative membrane protein
MKLLTNIAILFVAVSHIGILVLEMFFWNHPIGQQIFSMTPELAESSAVLAMNQGLYNGFLAAGLIWGLLINRFDIKVFFLCCVIVAGIFGSITAKTSILFTQGLPALIALILVLMNARMHNTK